MSDLISRADAMGAVQDHFNANGFNGYDDGQKMMDRIKALPSAEAEQVTGKLKNPCDSLLTGVSDECKEQKSKLESAEVAPKIDHDREWIIGCIEHDGFIHTHRFDKANQIIHDALSADAVEGEWLYVENEPYSECSKCGRYIDDLDEDKYAYCPYCGARMKGAEHEVD